MPMTDWPSEDRPNEKLLHKGEQSLTDAELIAIFIHAGNRENSALDIARNLLTQFGDLKKLLSAPPHELMKIKGIGPTKFARIKAAQELARRSLQENIAKGATLNNARSTQKFLADRLKHHPNEVFACLFLDQKLRLICYEELFHGTINQANIHPREIVRRGLLHNAAKIILAHNHPSGLPAPSTADKEVTLIIKDALSLVDIEVIDHIIIGHSENFSFAEKGLMQPDCNKLTF